MACLIDGLADRVTLVAVACLINRLANVAGNVTVACLIDGLTDVARDGAVACLIDGLADRVTFVTVTGFVNVPRAGHRYGFCALVIDRFHARVLLCFPHNFLNRMTLWTTSAPSCDEITTRRTRRSLTTAKSARSEQSRCQNSAVQQHGNCNRGSQHEPFHCLYLDSSEERNLGAQQAHLPGLLFDDLNCMT